MNAAAYRWRCTCCGAEMTGLPMDMAFEAPVDRDIIDGGAARIVRLDDDFCQIAYEAGEVHRFIRCLLPLPVLDIDDEFRFGVWMSVSEASWKVYLAGFGTGRYATEGCFGYLMNEIPDLPSPSHLHADIYFQPDAQRPVVVLHDLPHPLVRAQRHGIELSQIERWAGLMHQP